jgi:hypothetical protein
MVKGKLEQASYVVVGSPPNELQTLLTSETVVAAPLVTWAQQPATPESDQRVISRSAIVLSQGSH